MTGTWPLTTDLRRCYDTRGRAVDCAGTGQEGERVRPAASPKPRFHRAGDTVRDRLTGLVWTRRADLSEFPLSWAEAVDFVARINADGFAGHRDWRLPGRRELFSLVSHARVNPALPAGHPFTAVFSGYYWTGTPLARLARQAWSVHLGGGRLFAGMRHTSYMVWPVRGAAPPAPPAHRWQAAEGGARDLFTGLIWRPLHTPADDGATWEEALAGDGGWRLPGIRELESLVAPDRHGPALAPGHPFGEPPEGVWSATTSVYEPRYAWVLYPRDGAVGVGFKARPGFGVWLVKDG